MVLKSHLNGNTMIRNSTIDLIADAIFLQAVQGLCIKDNSLMTSSKFVDFLSQILFFTLKWVFSYNFINSDTKVPNLPSPKCVTSFNNCPLPFYHVV